MVIAYLNKGQSKLTVVDNDLAHSDYPSYLSVFTLLDPSFVELYKVFFDEDSEAVDYMKGYIDKYLSHEGLQYMSDEQLIEGEVYSHTIKQWIDLGTYLRMTNRNFPDIGWISRKSFKELLRGNANDKTTVR